jgi:hypothetical protein
VGYGSAGELVTDTYTPAPPPARAVLWAE